MIKPFQDRCDEVDGKDGLGLLIRRQWQIGLTLKRCALAKAGTLTGPIRVKVTPWPVSKLRLKAQSRALKIMRCEASTFGATVTGTGRTAREKK